MEPPFALPSAPLTVAAGQASRTPLDLPANVAAAVDLVRRTADRGASLLVLPELFLTGYEPRLIAAGPAACTTDPADPRLDPPAAVCAGTGTAVAVGAPVRDPGTGALRIAVLVAGRDGRFTVGYRKQHVTPAERAAGFGAGGGGGTVELHGWRIGLSVCWDSAFPEHARAAALDGCHAYAVGAMFGRGGGVHQRATVMPARALDNTCYAVLADHSGPGGGYHGCGGSAVWDPRGALLADAGTDDPGLAVAVLEPEVLARVRAEEPVLAAPSLRAPQHPRGSVRLR
ncbi:carbon-nitrogen hydrolase family protein [Streptomyces sp. NPDC001380]|uniref:carbon-nitrogen hydrolase family protein n=1 Tax=Streptomyces sp. NPDC001380 TaxID=3364566 RepID=UPI0036833BF9